MSKYKLYGAKIKKDRIDPTGTSDQGQNIEPIIKEMVDSNLSTLPSTGISSNITEGTLAPATSARYVNLSGNQLSVINGPVLIQNSSSNTITGSSTSIVATNTNYIEANSGNTIITDGASSGSFSRFLTNAAYAQIANNSSAGFSAITLDNTNTITIKSDDANYKIGNGITSVPRVFDTTTVLPSRLAINSVTGELRRVDTALQFLAETSINPAVTGSPTEAEILAYFNGLPSITRAAMLDKYFYYTGTNNSSDPGLYFYYYSGDGKLVTVKEPVSSFSDPLVVTQTLINSFTPNNPSEGDIFTYLSGLAGGILPYRNSYVLYDRFGNNSITKYFYITNDDKVLTIQEKNPTYSFVFNIPYAIIDSSLNNKIIGSISLPSEVYSTGFYSIKSIRYSSVGAGTAAGQNAVPITLKSPTATLTSFTADSFYAEGLLNVGGTGVGTNGVMYLEAGTVLGAVEHLAVTITVG